MKIIEYSEVSRQKITDLRQYLTEEFGENNTKFSQTGTSYGYI